MISRTAGVLIAVVTLGGSLIAWYDFGTHGKFPAAAVAAVTYFFLLFLGSLIHLFVREHRLLRKSRYAEILGGLADLYHRIEDLRSRSPQVNAQQIGQECQGLMDEVKGIFDTVTSTQTAACIKLVQQRHRNATGMPEAIVVPLCRDSRSGKIRVEEDGKDHWVNDNTGFQNVWLHRGTPFFCNDLPRYAGYRNTSARGEAWKVPPRGLLILRRWPFWPLKYQSTIIVAIPGPGRLTERIRGFLCIDSRSSGVFDERYGIDILQGIADFLEPLIARCHELAPASAQILSTQQEENHHARS